MQVLLISSICGTGVRAEEVYRDVPMPAGFSVVQTELEGPVFANAKGMTLYKWPLHKLRNGYSGESPGTPACYDDVLTVTAGLMSPYPAGVPLPELDSRLSCIDLWKPELVELSGKSSGVTASELSAASDVEPIGDWTLVTRRDGALQWAYDEQPLYTSARDKAPGDTFGGTRRKADNDGPAGRVPIGPPAQVPAEFAVRTTTIGRLLTTSANYSVYARDDESSSDLSCIGVCLRRFEPMLAPALAATTLAKTKGEWSVVERSPGKWQWVYRGKPLYRHLNDSQPWSQEGTDEAGWANVFTQRAPLPPAPFTQQHTIAGTVLADARGHTVYIYQCGEDSQDQLACDHPADTQVYRLAMCGAGDLDRCQEYWPYVLAEEGAKSNSRAWSILRINPETGRITNSDDPSGIRVWAYRDRPVYTFARDLNPGDVNGVGTGEWRGKRNGLLAFWIRDDFMEGIQ